MGDEFQGLLKNQKNIIDIVNYIQINMLPINIRFGIGVGSVYTDINYKLSYENDGPAYHKARRMIEDLDSLKKQYSEAISYVKIESDCENNVDMLVNSIFSLCTAIKSKWTDVQVETIKAYIVNDENQYKTAEYLNKGQPSISKNLKKAEYYSYRNALNEVAKYLRAKVEIDNVII